jgi:hypothetical protein
VRLEAAERRAAASTKGLLDRLRPSCRRASLRDALFVLLEGIASSPLARQCKGPQGTGRNDPHDCASDSSFGTAYSSAHTHRRQKEGGEEKGQIMPAELRLLVGSCSVSMILMLPRHDGRDGGSCDSALSLSTTHSTT